MRCRGHAMGSNGGRVDLDRVGVSERVCLRLDRLCSTLKVPSKTPQN